jgi:uncharacterized membrane protein (DUF4010 family)
MMIAESMLLGLGAALGAGLLIGIERERRKGTGPQRAVAGARTFTLASLAGAMAQAMDQPWLVAIGAVLIVALTAISYWRSASDDPGITTELALFVTYLLGVTAVEHPALAAGAAVVVAGLLAARSYIHDFSKEILTGVELRDALLFAGAALIVLPMLSDHPLSWLPSVNPRKLWGLVVLFMALQAVGYIALRLFGPRLGLAMSGLVAGFVSSTATIAALGTRARQDPSLLLPCVSGALFSTLSTVALLAIVAVAVYSPALPVIAPSIVAAFAVVVVAALTSLRRTPNMQVADAPKGRAFNLLHAIGFAVLLSVVTTGIALVNARFGHLGVGVGAAIAGFFDVHASAASVFALAGDEKLPVNDVLVPMLIAFTTNTISKAVGAYVGGGSAYALRVCTGLAAVLLAAWVPLLWLA